MTTSMIWLMVVLVIAFQVIGYLWYGPLFGKTWSRIIGIRLPDELTPEERMAMRKRMWPLMITNLLLSVLTVFTFAILATGSFIYPIPLAFILFLGIVTPIEAGVALWSGKPRKLAWQMFWITIGYQFIVFALIGILFAIW